MSYTIRYAALAAIALIAAVPTARAVQYETSFLSGGSWNTVYVQGFNTFLGATPDPGVSVGSPVTLSKFEFFKSGSADSAADIRLAIINSLFPGSPPVNAMTTTSPTVLGLSTNTIASTGPLATGASIAFDFANLPLTYGTNYAAVFVNVGTDTGSGAPLTPVLVSALTANYVEVTPGVFEPVPNYGGNSNFDLATSNFISGSGFFNTFGFAGDANFRATLNAVPEPGAFVLGLIGTIGAGFVSRRRIG
jgi:hypothetical protein